MTYRLVSTGTGDRCAIVVAYLIHQRLDDDLRSALPGACILAYDDAAGEPLYATKVHARGAGWIDGPIVLIGYSAGCLQGIRQRLLDGADPDAVVAIDGTHASIQPKDWQLDPWKHMATEARAGRKLFVATHTQLTYVETKPDPYQATVTTLRQITGWKLAEAGPLPLGVEVSDGSLHVHSYQSGSADRAAHEAQARVVLPEMLRRYVAPWLGLAAGVPPVPPRINAAKVTELRTLRRGCHGQDVVALQSRLRELGYDPGAADGSFGPVVETAVRSFQVDYRLEADGVVGPKTRAALASATALQTRHGIGLASNIGEALLDEMRVELASGVRETIGPNDSARIRDFLRGTGAPPGSSWCAALVRFCLLAAATKLGVEAPIAGSVGARATMDQLKRAGRWIDAVELRQHPERLRRGMIPVWWRGQPTGWLGHIGVVSRVDGRRFHSIEGNSGSAADRVAEMPHLLDEAHLFGAGFVD